MDRVELTGGGVNSVWREGDTVIRTAGPWTPMVHRVLRHLVDAGFDLAPQPFAIDGDEERLSYLAGEAIGDPWPTWIWADQLVVDVGSAARHFHDAVAPLRIEPGESPRIAQLGVAGDDTIFCHNDMAPYNVVVRNGRLVGIFDWDLLAPATREWELAFMMWQWGPLHAPDVRTELGFARPNDVGTRLKSLLDAYGYAGDRSALIDTTIARVDASRRGILELAASGDQAFVRMVEAGHADDMARAIAHIESLRAWLAPQL